VTPHICWVSKRAPSEGETMRTKEIKKAVGEYPRTKEELRKYVSDHLAHTPYKVEHVFWTPDDEDGICVDIISVEKGRQDVVTSWLLRRMETIGFKFVGVFVKRDIVTREAVGISMFTVSDLRDLNLPFKRFIWEKYGLEKEDYDIEPSPKVYPAVKRTRKKKGRYKRPRAGKHYTQEECYRIAKFYQTAKKVLGPKQRINVMPLAAALGRTRTSVYNKACQLGVTRSIKQRVSRLKFLSGGQK